MWKLLTKNRFMSTTHVTDTEADTHAKMVMYLVEKGLYGVGTEGVV
jgi:hypothetical protein